ncbi:Fe(3+) ABC transporter substrate-binding protein [Thalassobaculum sp. OXR-137]|uniref:Fe(3+) ABC transporter substrate-binding protein n=1 Tax=Thalassobaculum sp. OXR-137 TaxID=3100173 RepID=UPI002AC8D713|nr:Fe(3+) ABC transporter substrate-binding protein [Thalassobaculum sp. OXR-137]WPZ34818.1 Fe(3+) ABC transporter substrate-binding protein [Thalassobaculum sp. OXR-137]
MNRLGGIRRGGPKGLTGVLARIATSAAIALAAAGSFVAPASAAGELNLYSSRHYDTDERLYSEFEEKTGIKINRIEGNADELIQRIKSEGRNSPADVLLTVDAGRIWRAEQMGIFQPVSTEYLEARIPSHLRHPDGLWYGFSQRARIIFYDKDRVSPLQIQTYDDLADPALKGMVCTRSSSNVYMLSLMAAQIEHKGEQGAKDWAAGVYENRARDPQGGDTDQLRAIVSGECGVALANTYYFARALRSEVKGLGETEIAKIGWIFPNQSTTGAHVNISGAGVVATAPNKENAVKFLEYLASDSAQAYFSAGNDEYPAVPGVELSASVARLGLFRQDTMNLAKLGENQPLAQKLYDEVGYK